MQNRANPNTVITTQPQALPLTEQQRIELSALGHDAVGYGDDHEDEDDPEFALQAADDAAYAAEEHQRRKNGFQSIEAFKAEFPDADGGLHAMALCDDGNFASAYFEGNYDAWALSNFIKDFAYINGWHITISPFKVY